MKLSLIVATRSKPLRAAAVIELARALASGEHEVSYTIAGDLDQAELFQPIVKHYPWVRTDIAPRPPGPGQCWNRVIASHPADLHLTFADDTFPITPHWDELCSRVIQGVPSARETGVFCWQDSANPQQATVFSIAQPWLELCNGIVFDERFPFWFSDTAINELHSYVTGHGVAQVHGLRVVNPPNVFNPRMRDMELWWRLFAATRRERVATATAWREARNLPPLDNIEELLTAHQMRDQAGLPESEKIVAMIPEPAPITDEYLIAKANAEAYLAQLEAA